MFAAGTFKRDWKSHPKKVEVIHGFSNENIFNIPTIIAQIINYTQADPQEGTIWIMWSPHIVEAKMMRERGIFSKKNQCKR